MSPTSTCVPFARSAAAASRPSFRGRSPPRPSTSQRLKLPCLAWRARRRSFSGRSKTLGFPAATLRGSKRPSRTTRRSSFPTRTTSSSKTPRMKRSRRSVRSCLRTRLDRRLRPRIADLPGGRGAFQRARRRWRGALARFPREMCPDGRRDFVRPLIREAVSSAGDGDEPCVRNAGGERAPDGGWAHRIRVAPEEERSRLDRAQPAAEIGSIVDEPIRRSRDGEEIFGAPVGGAELCQVETTRCSDEHKAGDASAMIHRQPDSEDPPHRLSDDVARLIRKAIEQPPIQRGERVYGRVGWNVAEAGPAKDVSWAEVGESIGDGAPEGRAASCARKEYKRRHPARLVARAAARPGSRAMNWMVRIAARTRTPQ